ncbi:MAG: o-succinylbenzoate synthase [Planctomycetia bacterium]|nr:o-succinylbenzoate synthase [Planctomycetia bacterium]
MRIDAVELFHVAMPLISPWRTAYGADYTVESVLVRMESDGRYAWAESSPLAAPCYSPEWAGGIFAVMKKWLAPTLVGQFVSTGDDLQAKFAHFKGNQFAKAALDNAWWTLDALQKETPLYKLLGGKRNSVDVGADFGVADSVSAMCDDIAVALDAGHKRVKLKYKPGWDIEMLRFVRSRFPTEVFHIDCNSGYRIDDFEMFCRLDDFNLAMIEQPLQHDDLVDHARLQKEIRTPICLDETVVSVDRAAMALDLGSCRYINIKPGRVGGLTNAVKIHDLAKAAGIPCWVGGMLESAVGLQAMIALATLDNFTYPADIFPSSRFYTDDLGKPELFLTPSPIDGTPQVAAMEVPGIGCEPDAKLLEKCTVEHTRIET